MIPSTTINENQPKTIHQQDGSTYINVSTREMFGIAFLGLLTLLLLFALLRNQRRYSKLLEKQLAEAHHSKP